LLERLNYANAETQSYFWSHVQRVEFLEIDRTDWILAKLLEVGRSHLAVAQNGHSNFSHSLAMNINRLSQ
jgi:hypothetical protein